MEIGTPEEFVSMAMEANVKEITLTVDDSASVGMGGAINSK